jgi:hypothetical protein
MCGTIMRGAVALPWSKTASRRKGLRWNPGFRRVMVFLEAFQLPYNIIFTEKIIGVVWEICSRW